MRKAFVVLSTLLFCSAALLSSAADKTYKPEKGSSAEKKSGDWAIKADPSLPSVLILGDSISIGYTLMVREILEGQANVFRPAAQNGKRPENCQGTMNGVKKIDRWLAGRQWDVIHFNWGLHDLKHWDVKNNKNSDSYDDPRQAEPDVYRKNLSEIVTKLKATGAKLIFATTTPYPDGVSPARLPADAELYNNIAKEIMEANDILVNDLYGLMAERLQEFQKPENVHFLPKGSEALAEKVAAVIKKTLP